MTGFELWTSVVGSDQARYQPSHNQLPNIWFNVSLTRKNVKNFAFFIIFLLYSRFDLVRREGQNDLSPEKFGGNNLHSHLMCRERKKERKRMNELVRLKGIVSAVEPDLVKFHHFEIFFKILCNF